MTPSLETQLGQARTLLQNLIAQGLGGGEDHARLERRINALKVKIQRQTAENASVAASAGNLARELNINVLDLCRTLGKAAGPATRLSRREAAVLRTVYADRLKCQDQDHEHDTIQQASRCVILHNANQR